MPCLNEAETLATCLAKARDYLKYSGIWGRSSWPIMAASMGVRTLPFSHGARVVAICEGGYGAALSGGIKAAQGRYVIMGDSDDSYDFSALDAFVANYERATAWSWVTVSKAGSSRGRCHPCTAISAIRC